MTGWILVFTVVVWLCVLGVVAAFALPMILRIATALYRRSRIRKSPLLSAEATVLNKRHEVRSGDGEVRHLYYVTFQLPTGDRVELSVPGGVSGVLAEGDQGTLQWQGPRFRGFAREILR